MDLSRRDFLKASSVLSTAIGLQSMGLFTAQEASALETVAGGVPVIWLQGQACSGCSVSLLNSIYYTTIDDLLLNKLDLNYHSTLMTAVGTAAVKSAEDTYKAGGYILVIEGAIPAGLTVGSYCSLWPGMTMEQAVVKYSQQARFIVAIGACASFGGVASGTGNKTGAHGVNSTYGSKKVVRLPGCPANPDWVVGTIAYLLKYGTAPALDSYGRPTDFYGKTVHSACQWNGKAAAAGLGQSGCLAGLGCKGPESYSDCPNRRWNSPGAGKQGVNWCIGAGSPCIGCTQPGFPDAKAAYPADATKSPFYKFTTSPSKVV